VTGALSAVHITPSQSHRFPNLSETSTEDLLALPNAPLSSLTPEQLIRFAQIVDTALFKSYLVIRPGLLGPLCRLDNWCEVSEVEEMLQEREVCPSLFNDAFPLIRSVEILGVDLFVLWEENAPKSNRPSQTVIFSTVSQ
jgi:hypothetical protein